MIKRNRNKYKNNHKKIIIMIFVFALTFLMASGYSMLSQKIKLSATANLYASKTYLWKQIIENHSADIIKKDNSNEYIYKNDSTNNYLSIDNDIWRIISIENDHTIKIVKLDNTLIKSFDEINNRTSESIYCTELINGCNAWSKQNIFANGELTGNITNNSSLLNYLNNNYYVNNMNEKLKKRIEKHAFNIGAVEINENTTLSNVLSQEEEFTWEGYVGIPSISDYYQANNISTSSIILNQSLDNFLVNYESSTKIKWSINPKINSSSKIWAINYDKSIKAKNAKNIEETIDSNDYQYLVVPMVYLKNNVKLNNINDSNAGTASNPFILE